jgi:DNA primase
MFLSAGSAIIGEIAYIVWLESTLHTKKGQNGKNYQEKLNLLDFETILESIFPQNEPEEEIVIDLPSEFVSLANKNNSIEAKIAKNYLNKRNITDKDILFWKIGYCSSGEYAGRVIIPSFNESGDCNFFIARTYRDDWRKYMNPPHF